MYELQIVQFVQSTQCTMFEYIAICITQQGACVTEQVSINYLAIS